MRVQLQLRLPADLHEAMAQRAARSERTLNGQLTYALKQWLVEHPETAAKPSIRADCEAAILDAGRGGSDHD
jgi:hypothetical protein